MRNPCFGGSWRTICKKRTLDTWELLIFQLTKEPLSKGAAEERVKKLPQQLDNDGDQNPQFTKFRKQQKLEVTPPTLQIGLEATLVPISKDLGPDSILSSSLRSELKTISQNMKIMEQLFQGLKEAQYQPLVGTKEDFETMELEVAKIRNYLGSRNPSEGLTLAFGLVASLQENLTEVENKVGNTLKFVENDAGATLELKREIYNAVLVSVQPMVDLFGMMLSGKDAPGDLLMQELNEIKDDIKQLQNEEPRGAINNQKGPVLRWSVSGDITMTRGGGDFGKTNNFQV